MDTLMTQLPATKEMLDEMGSVSALAGGCSASEENYIYTSFRSQVEGQTLDGFIVDSGTGQSENTPRINLATQQENCDQTWS